MMSRWFKMLWRFWPGLLCLAVTILFLAWWLQPKPRTFQSAQLPLDPSVFLEEGVLFSPDRRLLAVSFGGHINDKNNKLFVYDLASGQQLFNDPFFLNQFVFDSKGALLYLGGENGGFAETHTHAKLMRWNPITQQKYTVVEQSVTGSATGFRLYDLVKDTNKIDCQSVLSSDGRWWVVPRTDDTSVWYERLDTRTGINAGKLHLPAMKRSSDLVQSRRNRRL